jgi:hypothetical protein
MKWVLIYIIVTTNYGATSVVHEFDDREACTFALEMMQRSLAGHVRDEPYFKPIMTSTCLPKSSVR